ncbi:hypothetical protein MTR_4g088180 [Medicago truncatula]|uniref:Uncharacterized protein n=1 Tax=Medicago truncatula TaxID=3880 RepID=A0A072UYN1_MEDTR|nr:hypothetical protein MTR_4g088180 [Medicago truncatula]
MRNPHLTPKSRGTNSNNPKRLKQEDNNFFLFPTLLSARLKLSNLRRQSRRSQFRRHTGRLKKIKNLKFFTVLEQFRNVEVEPHH